MLAAYSPEASRSILIALAVIVILVLVLVTVGVIFHRRVSKRSVAEPFTLVELRRMRREGQLTDQEFEQAKAAMIAHGRARLDEDHGAGGGANLPDESAGPPDNASDRSDNGPIG